MRTYYIAQGTLIYCGDLIWKENPKKGGDICICMNDSFFYTVETNTTSQSNSTPIKANLKKKKDGEKTVKKMKRT